MQYAPSTTPATYTTIPISASDVISRSFQNLSSSFSLLRPLSDLFPSAGFDRPDSLSSAKARLFTNLSYFRVNYALLLLTCALFSLLFHSPLSLLLISALFLLWLLLFFFREDPLILWGCHVADSWLLGGLVVVSILSVWGLGVFWNLVIGVGIGVLAVVAHGVFRNGDGLFLGEEEAASKGLIAARPVSDRIRTGGV
ncbi:PRA1 family protein G2 isoform X1 [Cinnamomum micranthum f. kanehirae]|uniref:PRA1 family protein n=1 Tax=Cinnamomum micranthum f. kanehirae TaxID=337451 RepID=A0A443PYB5_9MAGN|nr:PRA1 family protein G2 isoform X1 [Cinnamomum micranthum f. kanehirae]